VDIGHILSIVALNLSLPIWQLRMRAMLKEAQAILAEIMYQVSDPHGSGSSRFMRCVAERLILYRNLPNNAHWRAIIPRTAWRCFSLFDSGVFFAGASARLRPSAHRNSQGGYFHRRHLCVLMDRCFSAGGVRVR
jgi:hypothetical protein